MVYKVSIIVPAKDEGDKIERCLRALQAQSTHRAHYEVILVDDGSTDQTAEVARSLDVQVLSQANRGPASARNAGAKQAEGEMLLFTDADCEAAPDFVEKMYQALRDPLVAGAMGAYRSRQTKLIPRFVQQEFAFKQKRMETLKTINAVHTYAAAYRRDVFISNGGFDETYPIPSNEDQEFSYRLVEAGHRLVYVPEAIVYHQHDPNLRAYIRRKYLLGYWKTYTISKHRARLRGDTHTPFTQMLQILLMGAIFLFSVVGILLPPIALLVPVLLVAFLFTGVPFYRSVFHQDRKILWLVPGMLLIRAVAQALGLGVGGAVLLFLGGRGFHHPQR